MEVSSSGRAHATLSRIGEKWIDVSFLRDFMFTLLVWQELCAFAFHSFFEEQWMRLRKCNLQPLQKQDDGLRLFVNKEKWWFCSKAKTLKAECFRVQLYIMRRHRSSRVSLSLLGEWRNEKIEIEIFCSYFSRDYQVSKWKFKSFLFEFFSTYFQLPLALSLLCRPSSSTRGDIMRSQK